MPLRIQLHFVIDHSSMETQIALQKVVELADASDFMINKPRELGILRRLASGEGLDHFEIKECHTPEFAETFINAAKENDFPKGDMKEVRDAMRMLAELFESEMLVEQWASLMFRKYAHHGGMNS
jgi:hypothetical protein